MRQSRCNDLCAGFHELFESYLKKNKATRCNWECSEGRKRFFFKKNLNMHLRLVFFSNTDFIVNNLLSMIMAIRLKLIGAFNQCHVFNRACSV